MAAAAAAAAASNAGKPLVQRGQLLSPSCKRSSPDCSMARSPQPQRCRPHPPHHPLHPPPIHSPLPAPRAVHPPARLPACPAAGAFTNQIQKGFEEPRLLIVTDPRTDHQSIKEAAYMNIPVIAFCDTDSDLAVSWRARWC